MRLLLSFYGSQSQSAQLSNNDELIESHNSALGAQNQSRTISRASLSSRNPAKLACRKCASGVHSVNSIWATSSGLSQRHSFISFAVSAHIVRRFSGRLTKGHLSIVNVSKRLYTSRRV